MSNKKGNGTKAQGAEVQDGDVVWVTVDPNARTAVFDAVTLAEGKYDVVKELFKSKNPESNWSGFSLKHENDTRVRMFNAADFIDSGLLEKKENSKNTYCLKRGMKLSILAENGSVVEATAK